jgi:hypothetical protein
VAAPGNHRLIACPSFDAIKSTPVVLIKANVCRLLESGNEERWTQLAQRWARCFDRGGANHKPLLEMLTVDSLQWIAPI